MKALWIGILILFALAAVLCWVQYSRLATIPAISNMAQSDITRGDTAVSQGNHAQAIDAYKEAITLDPYAFDAAKGLSDVAAADGMDQLGALIEEFQSDTEIKPSGHIFLVYAILERCKKDSFYLPEAAKNFKSALDMMNGGTASPPIMDARAALEKACVDNPDYRKDVQQNLGLDWGSIFGTGRYLASAITVLLLLLTFALPVLQHSSQATGTLIARGIKTITARSLTKTTIARRNLAGDPPEVKHIADYNLVFLAEGGLKKIFKGDNPLDHKTYAIALLQSRYLSDPEIVNHFVEGTKKVMEIQSPFVVAVYEYRCQRDANGLYQHYSIMEYLDGGSLHDYLSEQQKAHRVLPWNEVLVIFMNLCNAVKAVHAFNIVHRDVKPDNFIKKGDVYKLIDFETVLVTNEPRKTVMHGAIGTEDYMSPEQRRGDRDLTSGSDIYSLALILYEMLTGHLPRRGAPEDELKKELEQFKLNPATIGVLLQALHEDPARRFRKVEAFSNALLS